MSSSAPGIEAAIGRSPLLRRAFETARDAHAGEVRSGSGGRPYIDHPVAVADELTAFGFPDEVLAAALLHDVVEDSSLEAADIRRLAGQAVAELVATLTDDASIESYAERKGEHRRRVAAAGSPALAIFAADKLVNVGMMRDAYSSEGEAVAGELKVPLDEKIAVWESDLEAIESGAAPGTPVSALADRLRDQLRRLRSERAGESRPSPDSG